LAARNAGKKREQKTGTNAVSGVVTIASLFAFSKTEAGALMLPPEGPARQFDLNHAPPTTQPTTTHS
jgi:hypothetical protein